MSNDLAITRNSIHTEEGRAKETFVLLCCLLFFVFQVSLIWTPEQSSKRSVLHLASQGTLLHCIEGVTPKEPEVVGTASIQNPALAPFYFLPIAINHCNKSLLMSIKGIGPGLAGKILQRRESGGYFFKPADLLTVDGIGPVRLGMLAPHLSFDVHHD